jgi:hypothetical protein
MRGAQAWFLSGKRLEKTKKTVEFYKKRLLTGKEQSAAFFM